MYENKIIYGSLNCKDLQQPNEWDIRRLLKTITEDNIKVCVVCEVYQQYFVNNNSFYVGLYVKLVIMYSICLLYTSRCV